MLMLAGGNVPCCGEFFMHSDYSALNALLPLDEMDSFSEVLSSLKEGYAYKSPDFSGNYRYHALPKHMTCVCVLCNCEMAAKAGIDTDNEPRSWDEFLEWAEKLGTYTRNRNGEYGVYMHKPKGWHGVHQYIPYLWNSTSLEVSNSLENLLAHLESDQEGKWLSFSGEVYKKGNCINSVSDPLLFPAGRAGLVLGSSYSALINLKKLYSGFPIKVIPPAPEKQDGRSVSTLGDFSMGIFKAGIKSDKEAEAAWKWIKFLLAPEQQQRLSETLLVSPVIKDVKTVFDEDSELKGLTKIFDSGHRQYDIKNLRSYLSAMGRGINSALSGGKAAPDAVTDIIRGIKELAASAS
jgi:ABC-type glycerol-3-phosphate transport system substrate-binding protein